MRKQFNNLPRKKHQRLFAQLSLGEIQLLQLGLWVIGEQDRVDFRLMGEYKTLIAQLKIAAQRVPASDRAQTAAGHDPK